MMSSERSTLLHINNRETLQRKLVNCCQPKHLCLRSKAAVLIILWTAVVGTAYTFIRDGAALYINTSKYSHIMDVAVLDLIPFAIIAMIMTFYPLSGFIADICCGRFKMVMISLGIILISLFILCISCSLAATITGPSEKFPFHNGEAIVVLVLLILSLVFFITGLVGYQANYIQIGLDQLLEAPSEHLGLFIHYATWAFNFSSALDPPLISLFLCYSIRERITIPALITLPVTLTISLLILYIISCLKTRSWFYVEPGQHNPYKTVCNVLNFARKHKYPLRRSAFTYCDDYIPSRLDFAKQRYGGPFTTEQVESVKTLSRILLLLVAMGPTYVLQVPASVYVFPLFGLHTGNREKHFIQQNCSINHIVSIAVQLGFLTAFTTNILFPIYIWTVFSTLRRNIPKIFTRMGIGIVLSLLGVFTMIIIDIVGHTENKDSQCMFQLTKQNYTLNYQPLNMHWSILTAPSVFLGIGPLLVTTTTFEFISAQSPHSMKGLLVGVFFAIQGFFQLLGIIAVLPFSLTEPWTQTLPSVISCGFSYLLFVFITGLLGLVLFCVAAKKYRYRERDDICFYQRDIEDVYTRYLGTAEDFSD